MRTKIFVPSLFERLNQEARLIVYALIETGCRPSESANLQSEHIKLNANVSHIQIWPRENSQLKTNSAIRDIPLTGISLGAMRLAPSGFARYRDKGHLLSATLMKAFKIATSFQASITEFIHFGILLKREIRIQYQIIILYG